jgi:hypothetical protein
MSFTKPIGSCASRTIGNGYVFTKKVTEGQSILFHHLKSDRSQFSVHTPNYVTIHSNKEPIWYCS